MAVDWSAYSNPEIKALEDKYLPNVGQGETMAAQAMTAATKLVYKWYNDGDVFDNRYGIDGWLNDLSSYANWLYYNVASTQDILLRITDLTSDGDYEDLLYDLVMALNKDLLEYLDTQPKVGDIYNCSGPFKYEEPENDEWDDDWED